LDKNSETYALYGELLWRVGKTEEANKAWDNAINTNPNLEKTYLDVYQSQSLVFQFEKAIATLLKGRNEITKNSKIEKRTLFSEQLTQLYIASGNYKKGIEEILQLFEATADYSTAQGRIAALMYNQQAIEYIENYLKEKSSSNQSVLRIYSWFLRSIKKYDLALEITKKIDKSYGSRGADVFNFGYASMVDGQFDIALAAFGWVIDFGKENQYYNQALFGYARALEYKMREQGSFDEKQTKEIIGRYRNIIKSTNNPNIITDAYYRIALIEYEFLNDSSSAQKDINQLTEKFPTYAISASALNLLGDIHLIGGNINEAKSIFYKIIIKYKQINPNEYNKAQYKLAEIEFYAQNLDSAYTLFAELSLLSDNDIANDALDKITLIEQYKDYPEALKIYAQAELKTKQKRTAEASALYEKIANEYNGSGIAELAILELANIQLEQKSIQSARGILLSLLEKYPDTIYGDIALLNIATTYEMENNYDQAIANLSQILAKYPRSIYIQQVREKIKKLRAEKKS
jgi:tetratricopeptide (TPR) repeat protein